MELHSYHKMLASVNHQSLLPCGYYRGTIAGGASSAGVVSTKCVVRGRVALLGWTAVGPSPHCRSSLAHTPATSTICPALSAVTRLPPTHALLSTSPLADAFSRCRRYTTSRLPKSTPIVESPGPPPVASSGSTTHACLVQHKGKYCHHHLCRDSRWPLPVSPRSLPGHIRPPQLLLQSVQRVGHDLNKQQIPTFHLLESPRIPVYLPARLTRRCCHLSALLQPFVQQDVIRVATPH
jgi:hypothetical protein